MHSTVTKLFLARLLVVGQFETLKKQFSISIRQFRNIDYHKRHKNNNFTPSIKNNRIMKTLYPHQLRPRVYFTLGFGWHTDLTYDDRLKTKKVQK